MSNSYAMHRVQLRYALEALATPSHVTGRYETPPASNSAASAGSPTDVALHLFRRTDLVAWVGMLDLWETSMCLLQRALGLGDRFFRFSRDIHTRRYAMSDVQKDDGERLNSLHLASQISSSDYMQLLQIEAEEIQFLSVVMRNLQEQLANQGGACTC